MQIIPPPVKSNVKVSKRQLFSLLATATVASSLGIAMGSSLRFQVLPTGQTPRFKPQQDFPPLAKWPPQTPKPTMRDSFDTNWENEPSPPQLVYDNTPRVDVESYDDSPEPYSDEEYSPDIATSEDVPTTPALPALSNEDDIQGNIDNGFEDESLTPVVSTNTNTGELKNDSDFIDEPQIDYTPSMTEPPPWFNKEPMSESHFITDGPVIISPDQSIPSSNLRSD